MMRLTFCFLPALVMLAAGCQAGTPEIGSTRQFVTTSDGNYHFYIGTPVVEQLKKTGTFQPTTTDWYSVITVPEALVTDAVITEPITLSLCGKENGLKLYDHVYLGPDKIKEYEGLVGPGGWVDPHYTTTPEGELIQTYASGDEGVYGMVQVHPVEDGTIEAAAAAEFWIHFGDQPGARGGGMLLGAPVDDPSPEDPAVADGSCTAPSVP